MWTSKDRPGENGDQRGIYADRTTGGDRHHRGPSRDHVPLVTKFAVKGDDGALEAETQTVQTAMDTMKADNGITAVTANDKTTTSNGQNTWTALPAGTGAATLDGYLKKTTPKFFYCWDSKGNVYAQNVTDGVKAVPADAKAAAACATPA